MTTCDSPTSSPSSPSRPFSTHTHHNQQKQLHPKSQTIISSWVGGSVGRWVGRFSSHPLRRPSFSLALFLSLSPTPSNSHHLDNTQTTDGREWGAWRWVSRFSHTSPTTKTNLQNQSPKPTPSTHTRTDKHPHPSPPSLQHPPQLSSLLLLHCK